MTEPLRESTRKPRKTKKLGKGLFRQESLLWSRFNIRAQKSPELNSLDNSLPLIFQSHSFISRFHSEFQLNHIWYNFVLMSCFSRQRDDKTEQIRRQASLAIFVLNIISILFSIAIVYDLSRPEKDRCAKEILENECYSVGQTFLTETSLCAWTAELNLCSPTVISDEFSLMANIAIVASFLSSSIMAFFNYIVRTFLAPPTENIFKSSQQLKQQNEELFVQADKLSLIYFAVSEDLTILRRKALKYRKTLTGLSVDAFDVHWDIREHRERQCCLPQIIGLENGASVESFNLQLFYEDLRQVYFELDRQVTYLTRPNISRSQINRRLLYIFQRELLPSLSSALVHSKYKRDEAWKELPVYWFYKAVAWTSILILSIGMIVYIDNFRANATMLKLRLPFAVSFTIWLVMDVIFIQSFVVLINDIIIPWLAFDDVRNLKRKLLPFLTNAQARVKERARSARRERKNVKKELLKEGMSSAQVKAILTDRKQRDSQTDVGDNDMDDNDDDDDIGAGNEENGDMRRHGAEAAQTTAAPSHPTPFNAAKLLLVSFRLARQFPSLDVSKIISYIEFKCPPCHFLHSDDCSKVCKQWSLKFVFEFILLHFFKLPAFMQVLAITQLATLATGCIMLGYIELFLIYPAWIVVPSVLSIVVVHYLIETADRNVHSSLRFENRKVKGVSFVDDDFSDVEDYSRVEQDESTPPESTKGNQVSRDIESGLLVIPDSSLDKENQEAHAIEKELLSPASVTRSRSNSVKSSLSGEDVDKEPLLEMYKVSSAKSALVANLLEDSENTSQLAEDAMEMVNLLDGDFNDDDGLFSISNGSSNGKRSKMDTAAESPDAPFTFNELTSFRETMVLDANDFAGGDHATTSGNNNAKTDSPAQAEVKLKQNSSVTLVRRQSVAQINSTSGLQKLEVAASTISIRPLARSQARATILSSDAVESRRNLLAPIDSIEQFDEVRPKIIVKATGGKPAGGNSKATAAVGGRSSVRIASAANRSTLFAPSAMSVAAKSVVLAKQISRRSSINSNNSSNSNSSNIRSIHVQETKASSNGGIVPDTSLKSYNFN